MEERLVVVYVRMDEKKLMKLSKLILEEKIISKKVPKMRERFKNKKRGVSVCLCVCFSSVYEHTRMRDESIQCISSLIIYMWYKTTRWSSR